VPEQPVVLRAPAFGAQVRELLRIYADRNFWRIGLLAAVSQASALALLGLWSGPWLRDVAGLDHARIGAHLAVAAGAFGVGGIVFGTLSDRLARHGVPPEHTYLAGCAAAVVTLVPLAAATAAWPMLTMGAYIGCGAAGLLAYPLLTARFPTAMTGRVLTALNMLVMACSFVFQSGIGAVISLWPVSAGRYALAGYQSAFGALILLQLLALAWALGIARRTRRGGRGPSAPS